MNHSCIVMLLAVLSAQAMAQTQTSTTKYEYDAMGNVIKVTNPNNAAAIQTHDELGRLKTRTDADGKTTRFIYNAQDQLIELQDARNVSTLYTFDGLGNLLRQESPDSGNTTFTVDAAGNMQSSTDAKGQTTRYTHDVLNRITRIDYHDGKAVTYVYDEGANARGRLSKISDDSGNIEYRYDGRGRVLSEIRSTRVNTIPASLSTTTISYLYDIAGRITSLTYPNGRIISYTRDSLGRISRIDTIKNGVSAPILSEVVYQPFGPAESYRNSAGQPYTRSFDLDGRITSYTLNNQTQAISYDAASRILGINQANNPARQASYGYDVLDRLISYTTPQLSQGFGWDATGNRTTQTTGANTSVYSYSSASNRLQQISGAQNQTILTDATGNITDNGRARFGYDTRGRMVSATTGNGQVQYLINALGQRVQKIVPGSGNQAATVTLYHYDLAGKLIAESTGNQETHYVYLDELPVAVIK